MRVISLSGVAKLITWDDAVAVDAGSEFAELARNPSTFFQNCIARLDSDRLKQHETKPPQVQPVLNLDRINRAIAVLYLPGTWILTDIQYIQVKT